MSTIFALVAGYFALLLVLSALARRQREKLAALAREFLGRELQPQQERAVRRMLETAYSMRSAPAQLAVTIIMLLMPSERFHRDAQEWAKRNPEVVGDPKWGTFFEAYIASVAAVNPIFGAALYVARALFRLKAVLFIRRHYRPAKPNVEELERMGEYRALAA